MDEQIKDVTPDSSTGNEAPDVKTDSESSPESTPQEQEAASTQEVKPEVRDNRPIENVAWESKRKVDELYSKFDELKEAILTQRSQTQSQPTYSKAQLMAYAQEPTTTTEQRLWAYGEVDKLEKDERRKEYEQLVSQTRERTESDNRRVQSANWVAQNFPDMVVKDQVGNPMGWNQQHPVLLRANEYMSRNKNLQNDPEGFSAAVKMAAFDLGVQVNKQMNQKLDRTVGQLRKEQKKQLASSGGTKPAETSEQISASKMAKLKEQYAKTGNRDVFAEMLKMKKLNPFLE
jgi:hypothetical protein